MTLPLEIPTVKRFHPCVYGVAVGAILSLVTSRLMAEKKKARSFGSGQQEKMNAVERWLKIFESEFKIYGICRGDGLDWKIQESIEHMAFALLVAYRNMGYDYRKITDRVAPIEFSDPSKTEENLDAEGVGES